MFIFMTEKQFKMILDSRIEPMNDKLNTLYASYWGRNDRDGVSVDDIIPHMMSRHEEVEQKDKEVKEAMEEFIEAHS